VLRSPDVDAPGERNRIPAGVLAGVLLLAGSLVASAVGGETQAPADAVRRGDIHGSLRSGGLTRTYLLHVPPRYEADSSWPLVLALHGGGAQGRSMSGLTGLSRLADRHGFLVVYPDGIGRSWNDGREDPDVPAERMSIDDVGFLTRLVDEVSRRYRVDAGRVYATGISNGGFMAQRLGCEASRRVAAIAPVVATIGVELAGRCRPTRPVPVLMVNGTDDPLVPFLGGQVRVFGRLRPGKVASVGETVSFWARHNGCTAAPVITREPDRDPSDKVTVRREALTRCRDGSEVILYVMEGGGHVWPGGPQYLPRRVIGRASRDIDSEVIWEFFSRHRQP
jgi:polyhydroxybutyrate depolymerase